MADRRIFMEISEVEDFLRNPPHGFRVQSRESGHTLVKSDPNNCCVFIDEFHSNNRKVIFQFSTGREFVVNNLGSYSKMRKKITSQQMYLLASASDICSLKGEKLSRTAEGSTYFIVMLNGKHPFVKWQMEQVLDRAISSVAGESYNVEIDLSQALQSWVGRRENVLPSGFKGKSWTDCSFTLKYHSDALFDIPFWCGLSNRHFKITYE
ncbi:mesenteric estrogen-dependent adipogenesis protein-like [Sardina pilchardus]|uniref:mesenteric estrogen-dependent adipogenesis protein-like n=1 Tax=Sardina pilchardus TaxID=27697 RepID=UPI002E166B1C